MCRQLRSVGLDVGTSTTQMILSRLEVANGATGFAVPKLQITGRQVLYESPVYLTPLLEQDRVDAVKLKGLVAREYAAAGITTQDVDTGAVIITGETSRKENARAVLGELSGFAGDFVVATAGPDLESVLAAKGAGAVDYSAQTGKTVLHMDIGGGTSNLALIKEGKILRTACVNVGGRLIKLDERGRAVYVSPVLAGLTDMTPGCTPAPSQRRELAELLAQALEMAADRRPRTDLLDRLWTKEWTGQWEAVPQDAVLSFSGGVAACMAAPAAPGAYGDLGPELGRAILESQLCRGEYRLPEDPIRATVIGAGCHSASLSGSTVYCAGMQLPLKNLPVAVFSAYEQDSDRLPQMIRQVLSRAEQLPMVLALPGYPAGDYRQVTALADRLLEGCGEQPVLVCLEADMAKALGQRLCLLGARSVLCLDSISLPEGSYLDVGEPVGPAYPVVVKTLVLAKQ